MTTAASPDHLSTLGTLGDERRAQFERDGFVVLADPVLTLGELAQVRAVLLPMLERVASLPREHVHDLAVGGAEGGRIDEIVNAAVLAPELRDSAAFHRCRAIAADLLGTPVAPFFDHVIAKPPHNLSSTPWHQDTAYADSTELPPTAHMWLALQDATLDNGCMRFVPGSHRAQLPHGKRGGNPDASSLEAIGVDDATAVACPVPAGGLTIHHPGVLHSTGPNTTDEPRLAWILQYREEGTWGLRALVPPSVRRWRSKRRHG